MSRIEQRFQKALEWEQIITSKRFVTAHFIEWKHLEMIASAGQLILQLPADSNSKCPYDFHKWNKKKKEEGVAVIRHQIKYSKMVIFGKEVQTLKCWEVDNSNFRKQVIRLDDFIYVFYFVTDGSYKLPDVSKLKAPRLQKHEACILQEEIIPHRGFAGAMAVAKEKGLNISSKQMHNQRSKCKTAIFNRSGPQQLTTIEEIQSLMTKYPGDVKYSLDSDDVLQFTITQVFRNSVKIWLSGCPSVEEMGEWHATLHDLEKLNFEQRREKIKFLLKEHPDGLFFSSRLFCDTTFDLGDFYVTFMLGETPKFRSKSSRKPRVIPLGFILHTTKHTSSHEIFADKLAEIIQSERMNVPDRGLPCLLVDGESALEVYSHKLDVPLIRCDFHIYKLLRTRFGSKRADQAQKYIFGEKIGNKWRSGLLGAFTLEDFDKRMTKIRELSRESKISVEITEWLQERSAMLFTSASAIAKLRAGHLLQYSTSNICENFNKIVKSVLPKKMSAENVVEKLITICEGKIEQCWLSAMEFSDSTVMIGSISGMSYDEKVQYFQKCGLVGSTFLALEIPAYLAKNLNTKKCMEESELSENLRIIYFDNNVYSTIDRENPSKPLYVNVIWDENRAICEKCGDTLPVFVCKHIISCLKSLDRNRRLSQWMHLVDFTKKKNEEGVPRTSKSAGSKFSNRIGHRSSANNHIRLIDDFSRISAFRIEDSDHSGISEIEDSTSDPPLQSSEEMRYDDSDVLDSTQISESRNCQSSQYTIPEDAEESAETVSSDFSPLFSSTMISECRRSSRKRKARRSFSPAANDKLRDS